MNLTTTLELPPAITKALTRIVLMVVAVFTIPGAAHAGDIAGVPFGTLSSYPVFSLDSGNAQTMADAKTAQGFTYGMAYQVIANKAVLKTSGSVSNGFTLSTTYANTVIGSDTTISLSNPGKYSFTLGGINFGDSHSTLTISAPAGSKVVLLVTGAFLVNGGNLLVAGGLTSKDVLYRLVGNREVGPGFVAGGKVQGSVFAPGRDVVIIGNSTVQGHVIAKTVTVTPGSVVSPEF